MAETDKSYTVSMLASKVDTDIDFLMSYLWDGTNEDHQHGKILFG